MLVKINANHSERVKNMAKEDRGFASMDDDKQREIARKGGESQGKENNPGNFANDREKASRAGKKGGESSGGNR